LRTVKIIECSINRQPTPTVTSTTTTETSFLRNTVHLDMVTMGTTTQSIRRRVFTTSWTRASVQVRSADHWATNLFRLNPKLQRSFRLELFLGVTRGHRVFDVGLERWTTTS